jgi:endonuclease G, mitochondrial
MIPPPVEDRRVRYAYQRMLERAWGMDGVTGVEVGFAYHDDGRPTDELVVRVYAADAETGSNLVSKLPKSIYGVPVSHGIANFRMQGSLRRRPPGENCERAEYCDPLRPGVSVANLRILGGTIGLIVDHPRKGRCILSCAHVLIDLLGGERAVVQPAKEDLDEQIGDVDCFIFGPNGDAAIATLNGNRGTRPAQYETGVVVRRARKPRLREIVTKSGMATGVTCGRVEGAGRYRLQLEDNMLLGRLRALKDQGLDSFRIVPAPGCDPPICRGGDSGSVWYASTDDAGVGLHVAGESGSEAALACYLSEVLERLGVTPAESESR